MKVRDIMNKKVLSVARDDTLAKALNSMKSEKIHQLVVIERDSLVGMLELKNIVTKDMDPAAAKVEGFYRSSPTIDADDDAESAMFTLLGSGLRALPVASKGKIVGVLSETDVIKSGIGIPKGLMLKDIMTPCVYVDKDEKVSKVKNLMFEANISRIPVLDQDEVVGIIGTLDLIKVLEQRTATGQKPGWSGEKTMRNKMRPDDITAESIMSKPVVLSGSKNVSDVLPLLDKNEELVIKNGEIGIITPKDVLELIAKPQKKGTYVQITGMHNESSEFQATMDKCVQDFVNKYGKMTNKMEYIMVHVDKMQKQGPKQKYSVRVRAKAPFGMFVAHAWGWKQLDVVQEAFNKVDREFMKKYEQTKGHEKSRKSKAMSRRK